MADGGARLLCQQDKDYVSKIIRLQACVKGYLVRRGLQEVRASFEDVVRSIENNADVFVEWKSNQLGIPKVTNKKRKCKATHDTGDFQTSKKTSVAPSKVTETVVEKPTEIVYNTSKSSQTSTKSSSLHSVEVQTNFVDVFQSPETKDIQIQNDCNDGEVEKCFNVLEDQVIPWKEQVDTGMQNTIGMRSHTLEAKTNTNVHLNSDTDSSKSCNSGHSNTSLLNKPKSSRSDNLETGLCDDRNSCSNKHEINHEKQNSKSEQATKKLALKTEDISRSSRSDNKQLTRDSPKAENSRQCHLQNPRAEDSTSLINVTSIWESFDSMRGSHLVEIPASLPEDPGKLRELRKSLSMELLWVQQAIDSRKNVCPNGNINILK